MPPEPPPLPERDLALLWDMKLAALDAQSFVAGLDEAAFLTSRLHQSAVIRALEVLGEAAGRVSRESCAALPHLPWREMTGLRHRLIHGYAEVRLDLVWNVATERLGPLLAMLEPLLPPEEGA
ncbi:MAG TPA: HepT-like ribonuclease domain-containing protein [Roseococcus sp.]|jgi:uncharacterized protein with HEPN domain|nr:HepT-like ribonuclease domain-containing protein [Roseococcus sp.]